MENRNPDENYTRQVVCEYKSHRYSVRDNGAIMRHGDAGDEEWTFGTFNSRGILHYKNVSVPKVVATAFLGPAPNDFYFASHIDGNVENNRPENLRWLSPLEQILDNPKTISSIMERCGSIDAFLMNPASLLKEDVQFLRLQTITGGDVLDAIKHLVSMSSDVPLRTGNIYVDWLKAREEKKDCFAVDCNDGESLTMDDSFLLVWSALVKSYSDQHRLARQLESCRKEFGRDSSGTLTLTIYMDNDMQTNWLREKKLHEMEDFLNAKLQHPIRLQIETDKHH